MLIGGLGNDVLTGAGGADVFRGGAGDDVLGVTGTNFRNVDGGTGVDTLQFNGADDHFDFNFVGQSIVTDIEVIDLTGIGNNSLTITRIDLLDLSGSTAGGIKTLTVRGNAGDTVSASDAGWSNNGTLVIGGETYDVFRNGAARLLVDTDITAGGFLF
jgi:hypothetical protein